MRPRILVTPRSLTAGDDLVDNPYLRPLVDAGFELVAGPAGKAPTEAELRELVPDIVGWLAGVEPIGAPVFDAATKLRVIARNGTGSESIDAVAAHAHGVAVLTAPGANAQGVAELALTLGLTALRDVVRSDRAMRAGGWQRSAARELGDVRVGVLGYGAIGRKVATLFSAVGAPVSFHDPFAQGDFSHPRIDSLAELAESADVLSLHTPPQPEGPTVTRELLATMPVGAILVNTARSALVDPDAVADALDSGRLAAYAVDAFDQEPPVRDRLLLHERTIMTPHLGGFTDASVRRATEAAVQNLLGALTS